MIRRMTAVPCRLSYCGDEMTVAIGVALFLVLVLVVVTLVVFSVRSSSPQQKPKPHHRAGSRHDGASRSAVSEAIDGLTSDAVAVALDAITLHDHTFTPAHRHVADDVGTDDVGAVGAESIRNFHVDADDNRGVHARDHAPNDHAHGDHHQDSGDDHDSGSHDHDDSGDSHDWDDD